MNAFKNSPKAILLLGIVVLLSRLPFLFQGYGTEEDSWGLVINARNINASGNYEYSRLPGHPVQELVLSAMHDAGPFIFNLLSAVFSAFAVMFFAFILRRIGFRDHLLGALAFAFIPVVYIASTYTIDYMWAMAFIMMAWYFTLDGKYVFAGLCMGLAIGCRITSGAMLLPLLMLVWPQRRSILLLAGSTLLFGLLCFSPVLMKYGLYFFDYYDLPYPPLAKVVYKGSIGVLGTLGLVSLLTALVFFRKKKEDDLPKSVRTAGLTAIILYTISYVWCPEKSAFLIPALPFVIVLLGEWLSLRGFRLVCAGLVISPFLFSVNLTDPARGASYSSLAFTKTISGQEIFFDPLNGPVFAEHSKRKNKAKFCEAVLAATDTMKGNNKVIAGWWYNELQVKCLEREGNTSSLFLFYAPKSELELYRQMGRRIFYLPEQDRNNDTKFNFSGTNSLASPLPLSFF